MTPTSNSDFILTQTQTLILETISRSRSNKAALVLRSRIVLQYAQAHHKSAVVQDLGSTWDIIDRWVKRWQQQHSHLSRLERDYTHGTLDDQGYSQAVVRVLSDGPRIGAPQTFTESQKQQIIALASQQPTEHQLPVTQWSHELIAQTAQDIGIVTSISSTQVGRFLKPSHPPTS